MSALAVAPLAAANAIVAAAAWPAARRFRAALRSPARAQQAVLARVLAANASSEYGRRHDFARLRTPDDYRSAVPIVRYEDLRALVERVAAGEPRVLTSEPVLLLERTSGSAGAAKLVPYTRSLLAEFDHAVAAWLHDLYRHRPGLLALGSYWAISPLADAGPRRTPGGLPIGVEDDAEYLGPLVRRLVAATRLVPASVRHVESLAAWRYVTLRFLVATDRLGFVSVWSPTYWSILCDALAAHGEALVRDVRDGTLTPPDALPHELHGTLTRLLPRTAPAHARALEQTLAAHGRLEPRAAWPRLRTISCWTAGAAARQVGALRARVPGVEIQGKGLLATEGVVSIPLTGHPGAALALGSHFLELRPIGTDGAADPPRDDERTQLAHELEPGADYEVVLTTGGGLYRYALGDVVRVVGRVEATPLVELVGRADKVSDLCGEKLHETHVGRVLDAALAACALAPSFAMLAGGGEGAPLGYHLYVEADVSVPVLVRLAAAVEAGLTSNPHYAHARRLGQLDPVVAAAVRDGARTYLDACVALGQRAGDVKPTPLARGPGWHERFAAVMLRASSDG